jgi:hypothetical protein
MVLFWMAVLEFGGRERNLRFGDSNVVVEIRRLVPTLSLLETGCALLQRTQVAT